MTAAETLPAVSLKERALTVVKRLGLKTPERDARDALADAQTALASEAADSFCALTNKLIDINGLKGKGVSKEILRRMYGLELGGVRAPLPGLIPEDEPIVVEAQKMIEDAVAAL